MKEPSNTQAQQLHKSVKALTRNYGKLKENELKKQEGSVPTPY